MADDAKSSKPIPCRAAKIGEFDDLDNHKSQVKRDIVFPAFC
jgi:hypothetical protein